MPPKKLQRATLEDLCYSVSETDWQTPAEICEEMMRRQLDFGILQPVTHYLDHLADRGRVKRKLVESSYRYKRAAKPRLSDPTLRRRDLSNFCLA